MTLDEAKTLLAENNIPFELREFENETVYWHHTMLFPYTQNAKPCKVIALIIRSNNEKKDIELQFNAADDIFRFEELRFGGYCFEMFDYSEDMLAGNLSDQIKEIISGNLIVIEANDIRKKARSVMPALICMITMMLLASPDLKMQCSTSKNQREFFQNYSIPRSNTRFTIGTPISVL